MAGIDQTSMRAGRKICADSFSRGLVILFLLCFAIVAPSTAGEAPKRGGTLTLTLNANPKMWPLVGGLPNILVNKVLYNYLLKYDAETLAPRGDLAESWAVSADGRVWTFHLRQNVQVAQLQTGALDFVPLEPHQLQAIATLPNVETRLARQVNYTFIGLNHMHTLFQDTRVRQALTYAIDRAAILKTVVLGKGMVAVGPISPFLGWAYHDTLEPYPYSVQKATALLRDAGWQAGSDGVLQKGGKRLSFTISFDRGNPVREQTAIIAQEYWKSIGVETKLEAMEFNALSRNTRSQPPKYEAYVGYYITPPDPDLTAYYGTDGGTNVFAYSNPEVDPLLEQGRTRLDEKERAKIYAQMQEVIAADAPVVFLYYPYELQALSKRAQNWPAIGYRDSLKYAHQFWLK